MSFESTKKIEIVCRSSNTGNRYFRFDRNNYDPIPDWLALAELKNSEQNNTNDSESLRKKVKNEI
jgi:hypothetical protein